MPVPRVAQGFRVMNAVIDASNDRARVCAPFTAEECAGQHPVGTGHPQRGRTNMSTIFDESCAGDFERSGRNRSGTVTVDFPRPGVQATPRAHATGDDRFRTDPNAVFQARPAKRRVQNQKWRITNAPQAPAHLRRRLLISSNMAGRPRRKEVTTRNFLIDFESDQSHTRHPQLIIEAFDGLRWREWKCSYSSVRISSE